MQVAVEYLIVALSLLALVANLRILVSSRLLRRDLPSFFGVSALVLGGLLYEAGLGPVGQPGQLAVFSVLLCAVILSTVSRFKDKGRQPGTSGPLSLGPLLPAAVALTMAVVNATVNTELPLEQSVGRFLAVAMLVLAGLLACVGRMTLSDVGRIVVISFLIILILTPFVGESWRPCDIFKCGPFDAIYTGPFSSENALAIFACVAILFVMKSWLGISSILSLVPILLTLYATESRTSQLALCVGVLAWIVYRLWTKRASRARFASVSEKATPSMGSGLFFQLVVVGIFLTGFYLVMNAEPAQFSNRGMIWIRGLAALGGDWWLGLGLDRWTYLQTVGLLPPLFPHSEYLLLLFGGGILSVVFLFAAHAASLSVVRRRPADMGIAVAYSVFLAVLGLTEAYWNPIAFDGHTFLMLPLIYLAARSTVPEDPACSLELPRRSVHTPI